MDRTNYTLTLTRQELEGGFLEDKSLRIAGHIFSVHGFLKIENLFPEAFISKLAAHYEEQLQPNFEEMTLDAGTQASHRRYIVPIPFQEPFNAPALYANPILLTLLRKFLGPNCILNTFGAVSALPGATDQHLHADYYPLFEEDLERSCEIPSFAITCGIPLVDIDLLNGPTHIWSGSHRNYPIDRSMSCYPKHFLHGSKGSCYFWDYRTFHAGGSNHTDRIRSLLYLAYTRRWFQDFSNPDRLHMTPEGYQSIPQEHLKLFSHLANQGSTYATQTR